MKFSGHTKMDTVAKYLKVDQGRLIEEMRQTAADKRRVLN